MEEPSKEYIKLMRKVEFLDFIKMREKAVRLIENSLNEGNFSNIDTLNGLYRLGYLYTEMKEYELASKIFEKALNQSSDILFPYNPYFKYIFLSFKKSNEIELLNYWLNDFKGRVSYDKRFKKFSKMNQNS